MASLNGPSRTLVQVPHDSRRTPLDKIAWIHLVDGHVLSTRSIDKDVYYLPGGKREAGESDLDALAREIHEELSVRIDRARAAHVGTFEAQAHGHPTGVIVRMTCCTAAFTGELAPANEIAQMAWLTFPDRERSSPVDRLVLEHLHNRGLLRD